MMSDIPTLWHYTCEHGHNEIREEGRVLPLAELIDPRMAARLPLAEFVWLTDLSVPIRGALGLTMNWTGCDRTRYRYRVVGEPVALPWHIVRRELDDDTDRQRAALRKAWARTLEEGDGAKPAHWYVCREPVRVIFDPVESWSTT